MKTRIITAAVALAAFIPVLFFSHTVAFPLVIGVLAAIAGYEMANAAGTGKWFVSIPTALFCFASAFTARANYILPVAEKDEKSGFVLLALLFGAYLFYILCIAVFAFPNVSAKSLMATVGMAFFAAFAFHCLVRLRDYSKYDYLLVFICAWMTDTFAIFGGKFFGKKKLAPRLSPKKTVAGMISGVVGSVVGFLVFDLVLTYCFDMELNHIFRLAVAIPASFISQVGDLTASAIKRDCGIKDYGKLFPGHGGVMDRFDSVMFVSVAAFLFVSALGVFKV